MICSDYFSNIQMDNNIVVRRLKIYFSVHHNKFIHSNPQIIKEKTFNKFIYKIILINLLFE